MPPNNDYTKDMRVTDGIVRRARVINLFGASGSGKSTLASGLHYELKKQWAQAEMAREFAKDVVHQETTHWFQQAILVLAEQSSRIQFIADKYDYVITDGPLMLASWYAPKEYPDAFHQLCRALFDGYENENFFLYRTHAYDSNGRLETEQEASDNEAAMAQIFHFLRTKFGAIKHVYEKDLMVTMRRFFEAEIAAKLPQARILYWT